MASETDVANAALFHLGDYRITDLTDADDAAALVINARFATARDGVLRDHPWNFARARASLAVDATAPAFGWTYRYLKPTEPPCLRVLRVGQTLWDDRPSVPYVVEGRYILTDAAAPLPVEYIGQITDAELFDSAFVEALALKLAVACGPKLGASATRVRELEQGYRMMLQAARSVDGQEGTPEVFFPDDFVESRR